MKALLVALILIAPLQANAILVSSSVGDFDVTTVVGIPADLSATLMAQPWWGDLDLASEFAELVGDSLGAARPGAVLGPLFGVCFPGSCPPPFPPTLLPGIAVSAAYFLNGGPTGFVGGPADAAVAYATAAAVAVPEPATLSLLGISLAGLGFIRRRKLRQLSR